MPAPSLRTIRDIPIAGKRVLVRVDFNVSISDGVITSDARIRASLPTIEWLREQNCRILLCSHLGRPQEGRFDEKYSLAPVGARLQELVGCPVRLVKDYLNQTVTVDKDEIVLLENVRFNLGENNNNDTLARAYAKLCDVFVLDAFGSAHRGHASTLGVAHEAPSCAAGLLVEKEVDALRKGLDRPAHPVVAIVGGSKISTKLPILRSIVRRVDFLIPGGGIANNFIANKGLSVGKSLFEPDLIEETQQLLKSKAEVLIPDDVLVTKALNASAPHRHCSINEVLDDEMIVDIGPKTIKEYCSVIEQARTIIWNGPVGVFEIAEFSNGTRQLAQAIDNRTAASLAFSIAGGGDTLNAIEVYNIDNISYVSTGGGAFLQFIENLTLVALEPLEN